MADPSEALSAANGNTLHPDRVAAVALDALLDFQKPLEIGFDTNYTDSEGLNSDTLLLAAE